MKYKYKLIITLLTAFLCCTTALFAQQADFPAPRGYINDFANIIDPADFQKLNALASALEQKTSAEMVVVTLKTAKPYNVEDYAVRLWEGWRIGKSDKDNGILLLVYVESKKIGIITGYGLEGAIPDAEATRIRLNIITPYFKKGEFSKGILAGTVALVDLAAREYNVSIQELPDLTKAYIQPVQKSPLESFLHGLFTLLFFILFFGFRMGLFGFLLLGSGRRRGGYWYGGGLGGNAGGFSGGFGGFGGGLTGGGGSWGSW